MEEVVVGLRLVPALVIPLEVCAVSAHRRTERAGSRESRSMRSPVLLVHLQCIVTGQPRVTSGHAGGETHHLEPILRFHLLRLLPLLLDLGLLLRVLLRLKRVNISAVSGPNADLANRFTRPNRSFSSSALGSAGRSLDPAPPPSLILEAKI